MYEELCEDDDGSSSPGGHSSDPRGVSKSSQEEKRPKPFFQRQTRRLSPNRPTTHFDMQQLLLFRPEQLQSMAQNSGRRNNIGEARPGSRAPQGTLQS